MILWAGSHYFHLGLTQSKQLVSENWKGKNTDIGEHNLADGTCSAQISNTSNPGASSMLMNVSRCCRASCVHTAKRHWGFCPAGCLPTIAIQLSPRWRTSRPDRDGNHTSLPMWNKQGLQGCEAAKLSFPSQRQWLTHFHMVCGLENMGLCVHI